MPTIGSHPGTHPLLSVDTLRGNQLLACLRRSVCLFSARARKDVEAKLKGEVKRGMHLRRSALRQLGKALSIMIPILDKDTCRIADQVTDVNVVNKKWASGHALPFIKGLICLCVINMACRAMHYNLKWTGRRLYQSSDLRR